MIPGGARAAWNGPHPSRGVDDGVQWIVRRDATGAFSTPHGATAMRSMRFNGCLTVLLLAVISPAASGQGYEWLDAALPERTFDFGTVARGSQLRHAFPVVNRGSEEIRILE